MPQTTQRVLFRKCTSLILATLVSICSNVGCKQASSSICATDNFYQKIEKIPFDIEEVKKRNGKFVQMDGIFRCSFENVCIVTPDGASTLGSIWLNIEDITFFTDSVKRKNMIGKPVVVVGRVDTLDKGHMNSYMTTLDSVFCINPAD